MSKRNVTIQLTKRQATQIEKLLYWATVRAYLVPSKERRIYSEVLRQLNGKVFTRVEEL